MPHTPSMQTPCIKNCTLEPSSGLCLGCGRSLEEIAAWPNLSEAEQARIMAELKARKVRLGWIRPD